MVATGAPVVLRLAGITKRFGAMLANDAVSFDLARGEVVALLGENGAGKTTLMNVLFGHYVADAGTVEIFGRPLPPGKPRAALAAGVGMVHQHFTLADDLSVLDNIMLGTRPLWSPRSGRAAARARALDIAARFGLDVDPDARVGALSVGERQRVEILKALYRDARILILDEPTAVLSPPEVDALFATLRRATAQGLSIVFISHKLGEVMGIADRVIVLRHGKLTGAVATADTDAHGLARLMVGADVPPTAIPQVSAGPGSLRLERAVTPDVGAIPGLRGIDLALTAGRITGIAGVSGNGQAALAAVIGGLARPSAGRLLVGTQEPERWSPRAARAAGIGRIPEDRNRTGVIADMTLTENAVLEAYGEAPFSRGGVMDWRAAERFAAGLIAAYDIRGGGPRTRTGLLSGGNVQKLVLARALSPGPRVILANQPTRGLDVGAVAHVHRRLLEARALGAAVLLISEDLDEVQALSDTIHVISGGRLSPAFPRGALNQAELGVWMAGEGYADAA